MNRSPKFFSLIIFLTLLLCLSLAYFISDKADLYSKDAKKVIQKFDKQYGRVLDSVADSLINSVGKNVNYMTQGRRQVRDIQFIKLDSTGAPAGFFYPPFKMTDQQADLFLEANIGAIQYDKESETFYLKLYAFSEDQKTISLQLYKGATRPLNAQLKDSIYGNENRTYVITSAP
jgi:hypothetical protein